MSAAEPGASPSTFRFRLNDTHTLAITGSYEEMLTQVRGELVVACPEACECRD